MEATIYREMRSVEDHHWWFRGRREIARSLLSGIVLPQNPLILDVGCGTGGNLSMLSSFGEVLGIELDETARTIANERGVATVVAGHLPDGLPVLDRAPDLIVLFDVLEHIEDDAATLACLRRASHEGTRLMLTVPAFEFLWGAHDVAHHHKRRYRHQGICNLIRMAGFQIELASYFNTFLFPLVASVRIVQGIAGRATGGSGLGVPPKPINDALAKLLSSERHILRKVPLPFGVSIVLIARAC